MLPPVIQSFHYLTARTLGELAEHVAVVEQTRTNGPGTIRGAQVGYHLRWAWPFATVALGLFALSLNHRGRAIQIALGVASCRIYFYLMDKSVPGLVWTSKLPPIFLAWMPNLIFVALAVIVLLARKPAIVDARLMSRTT
jgi:lipopolysaccharide export LptBFGC system permease protein LptF